MKKRKTITILAIETSCDDTGVSLVRVSPKKKIEVLSNIISSQTEIHKKYGGVFPAMAKREHQKNLVPVLEQALKEAKMPQFRNCRLSLSKVENILDKERDLKKSALAFLENNKKPKIDLIAVTNGPGLEPCLWVGVNFAKALASAWNIPITAVNHIKAHIFVNMIRDKKIKELQKTDFPAVCLIVSGGHTQIFLMEDFGSYAVLGQTLDDAAGECFDKTARILGLGYPGGPAIAAEARKTSATKSLKNGGASIKLPRPMINSKNYDFSFSGLKTAVLYETKKNPDKLKNREYVQEMAAEIQQAIIDILVKKTIKAARDYRAKTIMIGGGVAANEELRKQFTERNAKMNPGIKLLIPDPQDCTDNALMVAVAGYFRFKSNKTENWKNIEAQANIGLQ